MVEVVINYDPLESQYKIYEPSTQNLIVSQNLTEALATLNTFLGSVGLIKEGILETSEISYHLDSWSMKAIIESNVSLLKRLQSAPTGFLISGQKFGTSGGSYKRKDKVSDWGGKTEKKFNKRSSSNFSGATGFAAASKKFGNK